MRASEELQKLLDLQALGVTGTIYTTGGVFDGNFFCIKAIENITINVGSKNTTLSELPFALNIFAGDVFYDNFIRVDVTGKCVIYKRLV